MKILAACLALLFCTVAKAQNELPAISSERDDFFINASVIKLNNLNEVQRDDWMKIYNSSEKNAKIQRVVDIRWEAGTKKEAQAWFDTNKKLLGENGEDISSQLEKPVGVDSWKVYTMSKENKKLFESMGVKQNQYTFTFTIGQYVGKIFIATGENQTVQDAWALAAEGVKATMTAATKD
jgi:hypothetical protein